VGVQGLPSKEGSYWRTEARTPMQWSHAANAGFSTGDAGQLYLPVEPDLDARTVADQEADPESLLNTIRALAKLRLAHPALGNTADYAVVYAKPGRYPFAYLRQSGSERMVVALNPANRPVEVSLPADALPAGAKAPKTVWGVRRRTHPHRRGLAAHPARRERRIYQV
jgi:glycosidase